MRRLLASLWLCLLLAACAATPVAPLPAHLFDDRSCAPPSEPTSADDVFALSADMHRFLQSEIARSLHGKGRQRALVDVLAPGGPLRLRYDTATTRNAAQAFEARAGNCLSLVIMTAAFAKALDLPVTYQSADTEETWSRSGALVLQSRHVNLTLGRRLADAGSRHDQGSLTIDFLPADEIRGLRTRGISEATVLAMYQNNRAAEAIAGERLDDAYWWARAAIARAPSFLPAVNTLGVIHLRRGDLARAEHAFGHVLERDAANRHAMHNLVLALAQGGRDAESQALHARLMRIEPHPPFHAYDLGRAAMRRGEYALARELFALEVARAGYEHEFHFWLALANHRLGDLSQAQKHLGLALRYSPGGGERELYAAKLAALRGRATAKEGSP